MTSGSGPPPATTVISAARAGAPATSALKQPAIVTTMNFDQVFMTTALHDCFCRARATIGYVAVAPQEA
jgi:hypothetical protein